MNSAVASKPGRQFIKGIFPFIFPIYTIMVHKMTFIQPKRWHLPEWLKKAKWITPNPNTKKFYPKWLTTPFLIGSIMFSYGCYRGMTLPIWYSHARADDYPFRCAFGFSTGVKYLFCPVKYIHLFQRLMEYRLKEPKNMEAYKEWGIFHPSMF